MAKERSNKKTTAQISAVIMEIQAQKKDLRIGQIIMNSVGFKYHYYVRKVFHIEDEDLLKALEDFRDR